MPAVACLAGTWIGITFGVSLPPMSLAGIWLAAVLACLARRAETATVLLACGFALAGSALGDDAASRALAPPIRTLLDREVGGFALSSIGPPAAHAPITIRARLLEDATVTAEGVSARVALQAIALQGVRHPISGGIRLSIGGGSASGAAAQWRGGRIIEVPVTFRRPARYLNDGVPDFERALALDGIALNATAKSGLLVRVAERGGWFAEAAAETRARVRARVRRRVGQGDPLAGAIVTAILVGDRTGLPDDIRARLQAAGTYHVIAISGGNIAILGGLIAGLFIAAGLGGRWSAAATIGGLLAYAAVVDAGASVWRATLTAVAYLAARLMDHRSPPWNAMAVSALTLACVAPLDVRDVGFALTFGATAAILEAARRARRDVRGLAGWVRASVAASIAVEAALLPIGATAFSRVTCAGLVLNLAAVPLMTAAQVAGLLACAADAVEWMAAPAGVVAAMSARGLVESARLVEVAPWLSIRVPAPSPAAVAAYYACLVAALWLPTRVVAGRRLGAAMAGLCALAMLTGATPAVRPAKSDGRLRLTVFDVGQGEALLIQAPGGRALMVDTGGIGFDGAAFDIGGRVLAPALWARGVRGLAALALTHGDPDHIGGAAALVRDFAPAAIWEGVPVLRHRPLQEVLSAARAAGIRVEHPFSGARIDLDGVSIRVLHPPAPDWERRRVRNDDSLVLEIRHGDVGLLLTGDVSAAIERAIRPQLTAARVRILKVAHHGSRTSTGQDLLDAWKPHVAIISCGRGNRFGHPAPEVLGRLRGGGARIYRTDRDGQVTLRSDGRSVELATFRR